MLRKEREITDFQEIIKVLEKCDTIRLGIFGAEYPYVVPVSFGVSLEGDKVVIYFHGSPRGYKAELLQTHPKVCVEGDIFHKVEPTAYGITTRYESVIGFGVVESVEGDEGKIKGLQTIVKHYNFPEYPIGRCKGLAAAHVYKITLSQITGKSSLQA